MTWQAPDPASGTVASRIQAIQDGQGLRNSKLTGQESKQERSGNVDITSGRISRPNTALASSAHPGPKERIETNRDGGRAAGNTALHQRLTDNTTDKKTLTAGFPARPATSLEATSSQQPKLSSFSKESPERRKPHARQASLDAWSANERRLSEARARLKSVDKGTGGHQVETRRVVSPSRRRTDISELQNLLDNALDEQTQLSTPATSTKQSSQQSIAPQAGTSMASPTKGQSIGLTSNGSPTRHGRAPNTSYQPQVTEPPSINVKAPNGNYLSFSQAQQASPARKKRLSTGSVLPRSSTESETLAGLAYPSVRSSPEISPRRESVLHAPPPTGQVQSPVKERTATFEKMMQRDKQIMYGQLTKQGGDVSLKKNWWLDSSDSDVAYPVERKVKQDLNPATTMTGRALQLHPPASVDPAKSASKSGPIPLALPQLVSRGRAVSASSQFEDSFDTAPESEAALSRLSSRVHSPRTVAKTLGAQEALNEIKSPLFRWKPFMVDRTAPVNKTNPCPPRDTSLEANAGSDVIETAKGNSSHLLQPRAQDIVGPGLQSKRVAHASTSEEDQVQTLLSKRQALRSTASTTRDHIAMDGVANGTNKQAVKGEMHYHREPTDLGPSSDNMATDEAKEVAVFQSYTPTEESETEPHVVSPLRQPTKDSTTTPFPLMPVDTSNDYSATASAPSSPMRGRAFSRTLQHQRTMMTEDGKGNRVNVSRSRSKAGNVRVTVEVRTPQGSPKKGNGDNDGDGTGAGVGAEKVVIVTTDVQGVEGEE